MDKPSWDIYYLSQCFLIAQRSIDPNTKCGAVIVSKDGRVLSQGYNGPLKGVEDSRVPLTRPEKYYHMLHAEENALLAYNGSYQDIQGSTIYITNAPCHKCLRMILQKGITTIKFSKFPNAKCVDEDDEKAKNLMRSQMNFIRTDFIYQEVDVMNDIFKMLDKTKFYMDTKLGSAYESKGSKSFDI